MHVSKDPAELTAILTMLASGRRASPEPIQVGEGCSEAVAAQANRPLKVGSKNVSTAEVLAEGLPVPYLTFERTTHEVRSLITSWLTAMVELFPGGDRYDSSDLHAMHIAYLESARLFSHHARDLRDLGEIGASETKQLNDFSRQLSALSNSCNTMHHILKRERSNQPLVVKDPDGVLVRAPTKLDVRLGLASVGYLVSAHTRDQQAGLDRMYAELALRALKRGSEPGWMLKRGSEPGYNRLSIRNAEPTAKPTS